MREQWTRRIITVTALASAFAGCVSGGGEGPGAADAGGADVPTSVQDGRADAASQDTADANVPTTAADADTDASSPGCSRPECADAGDAGNATGSDVAVQDATAVADAGPDAGVTGDAGSTRVACAPPRLIAPLSTALVASARPLLRAAIAGDSDGAAVELCADRACTRVIESLAPSAAPGVRPSGVLPRGVVFWRAFGTRGGQPCSDASPTWEFVVPRTDRPGDVADGTVTDFDGDGLADVAVGAESAVAVYPGSPSGVQPAARTVLHPPARTAGEPPRVLEYGLFVAGVGDVNGDGFADLAVGGSSGDVAVYAGGPAGPGPDAMAWLRGGDGDAEFGKVYPAGDVNGDGYADVLVVSSNAESGGASHAYVFAGSATGPGNVPLGVVSAPDGTRFALGVPGAAAADLDGDGFDDVVLSTSGRSANAQVIAFHGGAGGIETTGRVLFAAGAGDMVQVLAAGDADEDGTEDLFVGVRSPNGGAVTLLRDGTTAIPTGISSGGSLRGARDVDGDGTPDLLVAGTPNPASVALYLLHAGGTPSAAPDAVLPDPAANAQTAPEAVGVGDVDGDGFGDVVLRDEARGVVELYRGTARGLASPGLALVPPDGVLAYGRSVAPAAD